MQISQVLLNLLSNSIDAVQKLPEKWIHIEVLSTEQHLKIRVTDSGSGISQDLAQKIFQPFFTTKDIGKGTGLGLSISDGIIKSHGGILDLNHSIELQYLYTVAIVHLCVGHFPRAN